MITLKNFNSQNFSIKLLKVLLNPLQTGFVSLILTQFLPLLQSVALNSP